MSNNEEDALISVIVPVYKAEKYLDRCIHSILHQSYRNIEVILVDDGSPDNCPRLCENWAKADSRVHVLHKKNGGAGSARNAGLKSAKGDLITFVDSDDWLELDALQFLYDLLCKYNADISMGEMLQCKREKKYRKKQKLKIEVWNQTDALNYFFRTKGEKSRYGVWGRLIKSSVLHNFQFPEGKMNEDVLACYIISINSKKTVFTNHIVYNYFQNLNGVTNSEFTSKKLDFLFMWNLVSQMVDTYTPDYRYVCDMNCKRARLTLLSKMFLDGYDKHDVKLQTIKKNLKHQVQQDFWDLMMWKMPISRKILLLFLVL